MKSDCESKRVLSITLVLLALALTGFPAAAATYTQIVVPGSIQTSANGINNLNQVVGWYQNPDTSIVGFLLSNGTFTSIFFPGQPNNFATGINDSGEIVGYYQNKNIGTPYAGWTYQNGTFTHQIKYPGSKSTQPSGINNAGQVVGVYVDLKNVTHGFKYSSGTYKSIDIAGAKSTTAGGINSAGDISGSYVDQSNQLHGYLLHSNGTLVTLNFRNAPNGTTGTGLNDNDQVVGYFTPPSGNRSIGFEWNAGTFNSLVDPAGVSTLPFAINNNQHVVGASLNPAGAAQGFLETP